MRRLLPLLLTAVVVLPLATALGAPAVAEIPRVQTVQDPRGDVRSSGSVPAAVRRSVDATSLRVSREPNQLRLRFRLRDVRSFSSWEQGATVLLVRPSAPTQRFTVAGARVLRGDPLEGVLCDDGSVTRRTGQDLLVVRLPFSCIRTTPGRSLELRASATATRRSGDGARAVDRVRSLRSDPRRPAA